MIFSDRVASFLVKRSRLVWLLLILLTASSVTFICVGARLNSDVLDMLPQKFESVQVYKMYNREFALGRELMFGIMDETGEVDLDEFTAHFAEELKKQPWIVRVMEESPITSPGSLEELRAVALPFLLNSSAADFEKTVASLKPEAIDASLGRLKAEFAAGSPKAEFQLQNDPLGIVIPSLRVLGETLNHSEEQKLKSNQQDLRVVFAITNQAGLKSPEYQAMAKNVDAFTARILAEWDGPKARILFTGRTAYEGELSKKLQSDVVSTLVSSMVLVAFTFWIGFRRWKPLLAILHSLMFCCLVAVALGALFFHELNMITIGLCAILVGLGVDFAMMLYAIYMSARERGLDHEKSIASALKTHSGGIWFGALTTAAAFLCMLRSDSTGFQQLGVLIACGILIAAATMMTAFWLFLGKNVTPRGASRVAAAGGRYANWAMDNAKFLSRASLVFFGLLALCAMVPIGKIRFEMDPKSLEPRNSNASIAREIIQAKLDRSNMDPVLTMIEGRDAADFHDKWQKAHNHWKKLMDEKHIRAFATPVAFAPSPQRLKKNAEILATLDFDTSLKALEGAIVREGFSATAPAFEKTRGLLGALKDVSEGRFDALNWRKTLPESSAWWFIIDRFLSRNGLIGIGVIWPNEALKTSRQTSDLRQLLMVPDIGLKISGWAYTLAELRPWSLEKFTELTLLMVGLNVALLTYLFRRFTPVLVLFVGLLLSVGALFATLKFTGIELNLFNILAFPLVLGVGVDYGIYIALALRSDNAREELTAIIKPVLLSGLTTFVGFASLGWAQNPALSGLGLLCGIGVGWCLLSTFVFVLPALVLLDRRK